MSDQFKVPIACARCGQSGWMLWQEIDVRKECQLLALSSGFYERYPRGGLFKRTETVCGRCGAIQPE